MTAIKQQSSFASAEYASKGRITRREKFLSQMQAIVPWAALLAVIEPHYPKGLRGRPPIGVQRMLRLYFLQQWYSLSDEGLEDALYDIVSLRQFVGIDLGREAVPDATTMLKFRRLLEEHALSQQMLHTINEDLHQRGLLMKAGTIVDATLIAAPSSTKNSKGQRDPEMHQTKKGKQWHFGMKAHIGVDAQSGLVHTVISTAANTHDITAGWDLLHGQESAAHADAGYRGIEQREEASSYYEAHERDPQQQPVNWQIAMMPSKRQALKAGATQHGWAQRLDEAERVKARIRARVEHPFHILKNLFKYKKVSYRGLAKNASRHTMLFALANLVIVKTQLLMPRPQSVCHAP